MYVLSIIKNALEFVCVYVSVHMRFEFYLNVQKLLQLFMLSSKNNMKDQVVSAMSQA